jgi:RepB DNA-primase from phage plasmid
MSVVNTLIDEAAVRQHIEIISGHAVELAKNNGHPGVLQLCFLSPHNQKMIPHRFRLDDVEAMVKAAIGAAHSGLNAYVEARTLRAGLVGNARGEIGDTEFVFGLVVDADHDKGKGGTLALRPSLTVETSPGNFQHWILLTEPTPAGRAKTLGDALRAMTGADSATGVISQCYRIAGTPNFPSKAKQARGRTAVEPTRTVEWTGRLWDPLELAAQQGSPVHGATPGARAGNSAATVADESSLPEDLVREIRDGGAAQGDDATRSALFHAVVGKLARRRWDVEAILALLAKYPNGAAAKYVGRLREEVERSYAKVAPGGSQPAAGGGVGAGGSGGGGGAGAGLGATSAPQQPPPQPQAPTHVLPTIQLRSGQLPRVIEETERALIAGPVEVFSRAGFLVCPVGEFVAMNATGGRTLMARLSVFTTDSFTEPVAESAIFQHYSKRLKKWVDTDPPIQLVRMVLGRERKWAFPKISSIITTPTLRADGSLLATPGYDLRSELYLMLDMSLPPIPAIPTREDALKALATLKELFQEFSFKRKALDLSVALAGLLTALLRGSLPTSPVFLVRAGAPGTGKSYLVDVISMIATGRLCPVITASPSREETEKRLGAVLLSGSPIVSLDNVTHDLEGELLCQITERPVVRIRILGRSEMPDCECHTTVFSTGNNITFASDMVRRGLRCDLETLDERPEFRLFQRDALALARSGRPRYVAAALTVVRAYLVAGAPQVCGPFGSYADWSRMVRSPLVWLGEPDPILSLDEIREEDPELSAIREFFVLWPIYLRLGTPYTTARIVEIACEQVPNNYDKLWLKEFLLTIAATRGRESEISAKSLGRWLQRISGRVVAGHRLIRGSAHAGVAAFRLVKAP